MSRKRRTQLRNDFLALQSPSSAGGKGEAAISIFSKILELSSSNTVDWSRKNIQKWRAAMENFLDPKNPEPTDLQDIYTDLSFDAHLQSQLELRKMNILNAEFALYDTNGQIDIEATQLINKSWFFNLISDYMDAIFFGASIVELASIEAKLGMVTYHLIPRRNTCIAQHLIKLDRTNTIDYTLPLYAPYILQLGTDHLGLMNNIVPDLIWKRHTKQAWLPL